MTAVTDLRTAVLAIITIAEIVPAASVTVPVAAIVPVAAGPSGVALSLWPAHRVHTAARVPPVGVPVLCRHSAGGHQKEHQGRHDGRYHRVFLHIVPPCDQKC